MQILRGLLYPATTEFGKLRDSIPAVYQQVARPARRLFDSISNLPLCDTRIRQATCTSRPDGRLPMRDGTAHQRLDLSPALRLIYPLTVDRTMTMVRRHFNKGQSHRKGPV